MLSIFDYIDISQYLQDAFEEKKKANPMFSLRSWAMQLGMKSHGPFHAMIKGERNIPKKYVPKLIASLRLEDKEGEYFEGLIDYARAKTPEEKDFYRERLQTLSPQELRDVEDILVYKFFVDPLHCILCELAELKNFENNLAWIKTHMRGNPNLKDIQDAIENLKNLGVFKEEKGQLVKQHKHMNTKNDIMNKAIREYHKGMSRIAIDQIDRQNVEEREFSGVSFNIKKKDIPKIKEAIREFSAQIIKKYEANSKEGEETYHLNLQFFSLSK